MTQEMLEILIGKHLDGEITPTEQRVLEAELDKDVQSKELLMQLEELHKRSSETVASEIVGRGKMPEEVFERAWRRSKRPSPVKFKMGGWVRFAAGLAAGLVMGLALHFVLPAFSTPPGDPAAPNAIIRNAGNEPEMERQALQRFSIDPAGDAVVNVDWYSFTDKQGNQWLVEGLSENVIRPAVYEPGL
ncbi:MAG: hypothetical protein CEE38_03985 [Planctomycetes bacterium B3_Pla]|nr:MAG: hypothetical protein CEE38_03985 [Planctomycetes bacterium B3_Pla]